MLARRHIIPEAKLMHKSIVQLVAKGQSRRMARRRIKMLARRQARLMAKRHIIPEAKLMHRRIVQLAAKGQSRLMARRWAILVANGQASRLANWRQS